jgi:hypothetical protein
MGPFCIPLSLFSSGGASDIAERASIFVKLCFVQARFVQGSLTWLIAEVAILHPPAGATP